MCNPIGANAQNEIAEILQRIASDTLAIRIAAVTPPTPNVNGSDSTWLLQKIFDAIERNSMEVKTQIRDGVNECLEAIRSTSKTVDNMKERLDGVEKKIDEMGISGSESNCEIAKSISEVEKSIGEKLAEHQKKAEERNEETIGELQKLRQQHEETQKLIQSNWEKASSLMKGLNHDLLDEQQFHYDRIEKQLEPIRKKVGGIKGNLEKQQNMSSNVLQEPNDIQKEQDTTPKPSSSRSLVSAEEDGEEVDLVIEVEMNKENGFTICQKITVKVKLTDTIKSIAAQIKKEKGLAFRVFSDREGTRINESISIGEQGIHLWKEGRLCYKFWVVV